MKKLLIASTSTVHGKAYLEYILPELKVFFKDVDSILFIPFARPSGLTHDEYTEKVRSVFATINIKVEGLHSFKNPIEALKTAKGIFTGGGNTFVLVNELYKRNILDKLRDVVEAGVPYFGTSAGSNIAGITMMNTNDMPIVYPPSFVTLGFLNFNLNPHYLDPNLNSTHMGETRETRIKEYHCFNKIPVLGLREGSWISVDGNKINLKGNLKARLFLPDKAPSELESGTDLSSIEYVHLI
ncbi:MAG: dipeptidase PepE [Flavobacteriaceae bacterium]|nr:dipeptidase PepE [Flavobacteriaceae bacterium]